MQVRRGWVVVASMGLEAAGRARAVAEGGSFIATRLLAHLSHPRLRVECLLDNPSSARAPFPLRAVKQ
jgi:hypothetical protein